MASEKQASTPFVTLTSGSGNSEGRSHASDGTVFGTLPENFDVPEGLVPVAVIRDAGLANEFGLAVLAMGQTYWAFTSESGVILCVDVASAEVVGRELVAYDRVRRPRECTVQALIELPVSWSGPVIYGVILVTFFLLQMGAEGSALTQSGRTDAQAIYGAGEWWRCATALFLHADVAHLGANLVAGGGFALLLGRSFGTGATWLALLLCGALGNALTAALYFPEAHLSIGASTAVFAGLGLLTGSGAWFALRSQQYGFVLPKWTLPLLGGVALLGFLGVGSDSERIDVLAHLCGFLVGMGVGLAMGVAQGYLASNHRRLNLPLAGVALGLAAFAWIWAI